MKRLLGVGALVGMLVMIGVFRHHRAIDQLMSATPTLTAPAGAFGDHAYWLNASGSNLPDCRGPVAIHLAVPHHQEDQVIGYYEPSYDLVLGPTKAPITIDVGLVCQADKQGLLWQLQSVPGHSMEIHFSMDGSGAYMVAPTSSFGGQPAVPTPTLPQGSVI